MRIIISILSLAFVLYACKKTRTCSCKTNSTISDVKTLNNAAKTVTESTYTTSFQSEATYDKVKKSDLSKFEACNNKNQTVSSSYTTLVGVPEATTILGQQYTITVKYTATVSSTKSDVSTCLIK
jgi:hypothetical protein